MKCVSHSSYPRAYGARRRSWRKPGTRITISAPNEVQSRCRWAMGIRILWYVMTSCSLISTKSRTIVSNGFDWLTRLFCSFPYHDTTLTVILKLVFCTEYDLINSTVSTHWQERGQECKHNSQK